MKGYLLDTNICVFLLRGNSIVEEKLNAIDAECCYITDIVVAELLFGAYYSDKVEENLRQVEEFVSEMKVIPSERGVKEYAREKARLWRTGKKIEDFDLLIGCTAKSEGLSIVTDNVKHFNRIDGLDIVNWMSR